MCSSDLSFLEQLNSEQEALILAFVDPDFWTKKFRDELANAAWVEHILKEAGF